MAVKLRMMRMGRRHRPFFRINAIDGRAPRNGRIIEKLGHYDPIEKNKDKQIVLNLERVKYWLQAGATPSASVSELLLKVGVKHKQAVRRTTRRQKAKELARKKGLPFTSAERIAVQKTREEEEKSKAEQAKAEQEKAKTKEAKAEQEKGKVEEEKSEKEKPAKKKKPEAEAEAEAAKTEKEEPAKEENAQPEEPKA